MTVETQTSPAVIDRRYKNQKGRGTKPVPRPFQFSTESPPSAPSSKAIFFSKPQESPSLSLRYGSRTPPYGIVLSAITAKRVDMQTGMISWSATYVRFSFQAGFSQVVYLAWSRFGVRNSWFLVSAFL